MKAEFLRNGLGRQSFGMCSGFFCICSLLNYQRPNSSVAKLAYSDAQRVLDGQRLSQDAVDEAHSHSDIEQDIKNLRNIANKLRTKRFDNGTLSLESLTLSFKLDENGMPTDCGQYERGEAHYLIEEVRFVYCIFFYR